MPQALWYVVRCKGKRGTRLHYLPIARRTPQRIYLDVSYCGRRWFDRTSLRSWNLHETPLAALVEFGKRAECWLELAHADVSQAERDLNFVVRRPVTSIVRYAKKG